MGKYIKYFNDFKDFSKFVNFEAYPMGPNEESQRLVCWCKERERVYYFAEEGIDGFEDLYCTANFDNDQVAYDTTSNTLTINSQAFIAEVWFEDYMFAEVLPGNIEQVGFDMVENNSPIPIRYTVEVKWYMPNDDDSRTLLDTWEVAFTQEADPNVDPVYAIAELTITSDGVNPSVLGHRQLEYVLAAATVVSGGSEFDLTNDWFVSGDSMMYQFQTAETYDVKLYYPLDQNNKLNFVPNLTNTDANSVGFITNCPEYAEQVDFSMGGFMADSPNVNWIAIGEGLQRFTGLPFVNLTNLEGFELLDSAKLPAFESWQLSWNIPTGVLAYANEEADGFDAWTAATEQFGWRWNDECGGDAACECERDGGTWDYDNSECTYPEPEDCNGDPECECTSTGGLWDPDNSECTYPEPDPEPGE